MDVSFCVVVTLDLAAYRLHLFLRHVHFVLDGFESTHQLVHVSVHLIELFSHVFSLVGLLFHMDFDLLIALCDLGIILCDDVVQLVEGGLLASCILPSGNMELMWP